MKVLISSGEMVKVELDDSDGEFEVHFNSEKYPNSIIVKESAGLPGNVKGKANGILYREDFGKPPKLKKGVKGMKK